jgi:WD40 repeat protein
MRLRYSGESSNVPTLGLEFDRNGLDCPEQLSGVRKPRRRTLRVLGIGTQYLQMALGASLTAAYMFGVSGSRCVAQDAVAKKDEMALAVAFSPKGTELAAAGVGGFIKIWEPPGSLTRSIQSPNRAILRAIAFSPSGKLLAAGGDDSAVRIYDVKTGQCCHTLDGHAGIVQALAFAPDNRTLAIAAMKIEKPSDNFTQKTSAEIRTWNIESGKCSQKWELPERSIFSLAYAPDGKTLASAGGGKVLIRDVKTGKVTAILSPDAGDIMKVAFSPDGKLLAGGGGYPVSANGASNSIGEVRIWDLATEKVRFKMTDMPGHVNSMRFSPDGKVLATGSMGPVRQKGGTGWVSSEVRLWEVKAGALIRSIEGKLSNVWSLDISPDSDTIVWCDGAEVKLTDASTGNLRGTLMKFNRGPDFEQ